MTYSKNTWVDGPSGGTPLSAARLNHMEDGVAAAAVLAEVGDPATATGAALTTAFAPPSQNIPSPRLPQRDVYSGIDNLNGWTFADTSGASTTANWSLAGGLLTRANTSTATDDVALLPNVMQDGLISCLIRSRASAAAASTYYLGIVARAIGTDRLVVLMQDGISGGAGRRVAAYRVNGGAYTSLLGFTAIAAGPVSPPDDPADLDLSVEMSGDTFQIRVNGAKVGGKLAIPATLARPGQFGLMVKPQDTARVFQSLRAVEYDWRYLRSDKLKVLALGSSITAAYGVTGYPGDPNPPASFRVQVGAGLARRTVGGTATVVNGGILGDTTTQMLARLPGLLSSTTPDVVLLETSVNDAKLSAPVSPTTTQANLRSMVQKVKAAGAVPVLWTSLPFDPAGVASADFTGACYQPLQLANALTRQLAQEERVFLADCNRAANGVNGPTYIQADKIHPNDAGHALIAQTVLDVLLGAARL